MAHQRQHPLNGVVTNAAHGLGRAVAEQFALEGGRLILLGDPADKEELHEVGALCGRIGSPGADIQWPDPADAQAMHRVAVSVLSRHGSVDVLVLAPGHSARSARSARSGPGSMLKGDPEAWDLEISTNLLSAQRLMAGLIPDMVSKGRGVMVIAVMEGQVAEAGEGKEEGEEDPVGAAWRAGLRGWLAACYEELRGKGIGVMLIETPANPTPPECAAAAEAALLPFRLSANSVPAVLKLQRLPGGAKGGGLRSIPYKPSGPTPKGLVAHGGMVEETGSRMVSADPKNLEPEEGHVYSDQPERDPRMLVQCFAPFNAETPHPILASNYLTPATLHFVRNHLPVPKHMDEAAYRLRIEIGSSTTELSLEEIKARYPKVEVVSVIQCAGNRRNDLAAVGLVVGRAPWNAGGIGNARWGGARLRDVLGDLWAGAGLQLDSPEDSQFKHVVFQGADQLTEKWYEVSIPFAKAVDIRGDVILAYEMNGGLLPLDHGCPLRVVVPGFVGARQCKWLERITLSQEESQSAWQRKDYKLMPPYVKTIEQADWGSMPPVEDLNVQSAILLPEPGTVLARGTASVTARGYAWSGNGQPIVRVDVSGDGGSTWVVAKLVEGAGQPAGRAWAWVLWKAELEVPSHLQEAGGKWTLCCKALDRCMNTQPERPESVWNFRGLCCNSWHSVDICLL